MRMRMGEDKNCSRDMGIYLHTVQTSYYPLALVEFSHSTFMQVVKENVWSCLCDSTGKAVAWFCFITVIGQIREFG